MNDKKKFVAVNYTQESAKPYIMGFDLNNNNSERNILFLGEGTKISNISAIIKPTKINLDLNNEEILLNISFMNTNLQNWVQGKIFNYQPDKIIIGINNEPKTIIFPDGSSCKTKGISIEALLKEKKQLESGELSNQTKKVIDDNILDKQFKNNIGLMLQGLQDSYFFQKAEKRSTELNNFIKEYGITFVNKDYAMDFYLQTMRDDKIFIPNKLGNKGKLLSKEAHGRTYLTKRTWKASDLENIDLISECKAAGQHLFNKGEENYYNESHKLFQDPKIKNNFDAYIGQLKMFMAGYQDKVIELMEISASDF